MKYENYLVAISVRGVKTYRLARGYRLEDNRLAYCKMVEPQQFNYCIIDVDSGLYILKATSKKKVLEAWNEKSNNPEFIQAINNVRLTENYFNRVEELYIEEKLWRESGYIIKGEGIKL